MCVELPSKVIAIKEKTAKVRQGEASLWVDVSTLEEEVKEGDYLIVYQKVAINKIPQEQIEEILDLLEEVPEPHHH